MPVSPELRELLVCPRCKGDLIHRLSPESLDCTACRLRYPVRDDIPVMLLDEAEHLGEDDRHS
ncbi:MAG: Trm112 family protein [Desulfuromonadia bacterium]